jgi:hypothetical protein
MYTMHLTSGYTGPQKARPVNITLCVKAMGTHYREVDYRVDWIRDIFSSLNHGFATIQDKLDNIDYFDGLFAQEQAESILGIAFVTAQIYITGTIADISEISSDCTLSKPKMLSIGSSEVSSGITKVFLINTIANYYKHHEEWTGWEVNQANKKTIETLNICGINKDCEFPCHEAAQIIWPNEVLCELNYLLNVLVEWRENLVRHVKNT